MTTPIPPDHDSGKRQHDGLHAGPTDHMLSHDAVERAHDVGDKLAAAIAIYDIHGQRVDIHDVHVHITNQYVFPDQTPNPPSLLERIDAERRLHDGLAPIEVKLSMPYVDFTSQQRQIFSHIELMLKIAGLDCVFTYHRPGSTIIQIIFPDHAVDPFLDLANSGVFSSIKIQVARRVYTLNGATLADGHFANYKLSAAFLKFADLTNSDLNRANLSYADAKGANFTAANLEGADLSHADLTDSVLRSARLFNANLDGAQLSGADLRLALFNRMTVWPQNFNPQRTGALGPQTVMPGVPLANTNLADADLFASHFHNADFSNANLTGANLDDADLSGADLRGANLVDASLHGTDLSRALYDRHTRWPSTFNFRLVRAIGPHSILTNAHFSRTILAGYDLRGIHFAVAQLNGSDFSGANLTRSTMTDANLSGAKLTNARLDYVDLTSATLRAADLSHALLRRAHLDSARASDANLHGANLQGASLTSADFRGANLSRATLLRANATGADFSQANLSRTNLIGTNFTAANLTGCILTGAKYDATTIWPDGFLIPYGDMTYVQRNPVTVEPAPAPEPPPEPVPAPAEDTPPPPVRTDDLGLQLATRIGFDVTSLFLWLAYAFALRSYVGTFTSEPSTMLRLLQILAVALTLVPISAYLIRDVEDIADFLYRRPSRSEAPQPERALAIALLIRTLRILAAASFGVACVMLGIYINFGQTGHLFSTVIAALSAVLYVVTPYVLPNPED